MAVVDLRRTHYADPVTALGESNRQSELLASSVELEAEAAFRPLLSAESLIPGCEVVRRGLQRYGGLHR